MYRFLAAKTDRDTKIFFIYVEAEGFQNGHLKFHAILPVCLPVIFTNVKLRYFLFHVPNQMVICLLTLMFIIVKLLMISLWKLFIIAVLNNAVHS